MINRVLIIVCFVWFTLVISKAQSTGYLGKRVLLGYGFNTSPAFFDGNANNKSIIGRNGSSESGSFAFNLVHEGFIEIAPSSRWEIGFSLRYYKTVCDNSREFRSISYQNYFFQFKDSHPKGYYNITGMSYTLYFRYFGRRYIAPWGRYLMFGPVLNRIKTVYDPVIMNAAAYDLINYSNRDTLVSNFGPTEQTFSGFNIMFGFGRSRIIANRIVVDYGVNTQLLALVSTLFDMTDSETLYWSDVDNTNYIKVTSHARIRGINRFNVFLKVGILLF